MRGGLAALLCCLAAAIAAPAGAQVSAPISAPDPAPAPAPVPAQSAAAGQGGGDRTVVLRSFDGSTQLRGALVGFDGSSYTVETVLGTLQVDALRVECEGAACPQNALFGAQFGIGGASTIGDRLMPALVQGYADSLDATLIAEVGADPLSQVLRVIHPNGREMAAIQLEAAGTAGAFGALASREAAIAMASRRARDRDVELLAPAGIGDPRDTPSEHVLALDAVVAVVHPGNPVRSLSIDDLAAAFSGEITDWEQLGGLPGPIMLYARDDDSGTVEAFRAQVLAPRGLEITRSARRLTGDAEVADSVASDPRALGLTAVAYRRAARALPIRQACGLLSYPTTFAIKAEEYPLISRLYLYTPPSEMPAHAAQLVAFAMSEAAQPLIAETGFIDGRVESLPLDAQGARLVHGIAGEEEFSLELMREMLRALDDATRLSMTFRFTPGSSQLTPKSVADARRLAEDLASGVYAGREVLLVGFTDSIGRFDLNRALSARRAGTVEDELRATLPPGTLDQANVGVLGFGELTPVGCNETLEGRTANRRVEVWVRSRR